MKTLERSIQKETDRSMGHLHEKTSELKRQIDQLDRRLKDRAEIVEVSFDDASVLHICTVDRIFLMGISFSKRRETFHRK